MTIRNTPIAFRLPIVSTPLAASLLTGCASELPTQTAKVRMGGNPLSPTPPVAREAACTAQPKGEMFIHMKGKQDFVTLAVNNTSLNLLLDTFVTALAPSAVQRLAPAFSAG